MSEINKENLYLHCQICLVNLCNLLKQYRLLKEQLLQQQDHGPNQNKGYAAFQRKNKKQNLQHQVKHLRHGELVVYDTKTTKDLNKWIEDIVGITLTDNEKCTKICYPCFNEMRKLLEYRESLIHSEKVNRNFCFESNIKSRSSFLKVFCHLCCCKLSADTGSHEIYTENMDQRTFDIKAISNYEVGYKLCNICYESLKIFIQFRRIGKMCLVIKHHLRNGKIFVSDLDVGNCEGLEYYDLLPDFKLGNYLKNPNKTNNGEKEMVNPRNEEIVTLKYDSFSKPLVESNGNMYIKFSDPTRDGAAVELRPQTEMTQTYEPNEQNSMNSNAPVADESEMFEMCDKAQDEFKLYPKVNLDVLRTDEVTIKLLNEFMFESTEAKAAFISTNALNIDEIDLSPYIVSDSEFIAMKFDSDEAEKYWRDIIGSNIVTSIINSCSKENGLAPEIDLTASTIGNASIMDHHKVENNEKKCKTEDIVGMEFKCNECNIKFRDRIFYNGHINKIHMGKDRPYICEECPKAYRLPQYLKRHCKKAHKKIAPIQLNTPMLIHQAANAIANGNAAIAKLALSRTTVLKPHDSQSNEEVINLMDDGTCSKCRLRFKEQKDFVNHMHSKHNTNCRYKCSQCDQRLQTIEACKIHANMHKKTENSFDCDDNLKQKSCKEQISPDRNLMKDVEQSCPYCKKLFRKPCDLATHLISEHNWKTRCQCIHCGMYFKQRKQLEVHKTNAHNDTTQYHIIAKNNNMAVVHGDMNFENNNNCSDNDNSDIISNNNNNNHNNNDNNQSTGEINFEHNTASNSNNNKINKIKQANTRKIGKKNGM